MIYFDGKLTELILIRFYGELFKLLLSFYIFAQIPLECDSPKKNVFVAISCQVSSQEIYISTTYAITNHGASPNSVLEELWRRII